jgi:drug/metabolite transporter (DMT)-like permease
VSTAAFVLPLALLAAFLFALAAFFQQRAARTVGRRGRSIVGGAAGLMARLVRDRTWLTGWLVNLAGFASQAAALRLGSVAAVQPVLVTQLLFALPMTSLERHRWPRPRDWASAAAICGGLAVLLLVDGAAPLSGQANRGRVLLAALSAVGGVVVLVLVATRVRRQVASVLVAAAAGLCFSMSAVFMKLTADDLVDRGVGHTARDWVGYALAVSTLLGLVLEQSAFATGSLPWSVATMNAVNPVASYAVGMLAFDMAVPADAGSLAGIAVAGLLVVAGVFGLAHSPSAALWSASQPPVAQEPAVR